MRHLASLLALAVAVLACARAPEPVDAAPPDATLDVASDLASGIDASAMDLPANDDVPLTCADVACPPHSHCAVRRMGLRCPCDTGYHREGTDCVLDAPVDVCLGITCAGHGHCVATAGVASCVCDTGYRVMDLTCVPNAAPDPCAGITCSGHGTCVAAGGNVGCVCAPGFRASGLLCVPATAPTPCDGVSCSGHGRCVESGGAAACVCDAGFHPSGTACVADAAPDPCVGVTCSGHGRCAASGTVATCLCEAGYRPSGTTCVRDAPLDPCAGVMCSGHGRCTASAGAASCTCDAGYRASGLSCIPTTSADPCAGVTCSGHGRCDVVEGRASCHCDAGYASRLVPTNCQLAAGTVCEGVSCGMGTCLVDVIGTAVARCTCDPGFVVYGMGCIPERRVACRDRDGTRRLRGSTRCGPDDTILEVCRDLDGDGLMEWAFGVACAAGTTCSGTCRTARCPTQPCPIGTTCLVSAHDVPIGACVPTCACTSCGNCARGTFGGALIRWCGSTSGPPAVAACENPCPDPGDGCLTTTVPMCYPTEGCISGTPR